MTKSSRLHVVTAIAAFGALSSITGLAQSFVFPNFSDTSALQINGNAAVVNNGTSDVLRLTPASAGQAGSAFSLNTVQLGSNASFSTAFTFQLTGGGGIGDGTANPAGADGIVFVLNTLSNSVGSSGQGVGYQGIGHSVGIKFDTWADSDANGFPQDSDPNGNFVSIYTNGNTDTDGHSFYTPGTSMKNGDFWYAWIDYDGASHQLDVRLSDGLDVRPGIAQLSETIDLTDVSLLGFAPNVYAGFTSGTGGAFNNHDIVNWAFNDSFDPIGGVPSTPDGAPTIGLMGLGLTLLGGLRRGFRRA